MPSKPVLAVLGGLVAFSACACNNRSAEQEAEVEGSTVEPAPLDRTRMQDASAGGLAQRPRDAAGSALLGQARADAAGAAKREQNNSQDRSRSNAEAPDAGGQTGTTTEHKTGKGNGVGPGEAGSGAGNADGRPGEQ